MSHFIYTSNERLRKLRNTLEQFYYWCKEVLLPRGLKEARRKSQHITNHQLERPANKERTTVSPADGLGETGYPHTGKMKIDPYLIPSRKKLTELQRPNMKNLLKLNHNKKKNGPIQICLKDLNGHLCKRPIIKQWASSAKWRPHHSTCFVWKELPPLDSSQK